MRHSDPLDPVAVVGIGCRFPGGADSPEEFWRLLEDGVDAVGPMPSGRFDVERFLHPEPGTPGKIVTAEGGFLQGIDLFDAAFFEISPREARKIDPQHRLLMEVAWQAMEDGGVVPSSLSGPRTGVYMGLWSGEYESVMYRTPETLDFHSVTGGGRYSASGRVAWAYDLRGPCVTVDSGCSASLAALHMARQAILDDEIDAAIVGAANLILQPHVGVAYSRSGMLSAGARCRFGDARASGYVRSEGAAALVLKRLDVAERDGDRIRGLILGTAVNADGRASGQLATPSTEAQRELLETIYGRAGVDPRTLPYVEAHGTGTRAGDPVELRALGEVLGRGRPADRPLLVGSVKTNIGHTEACAGMAGLIKTLLAVEKGRIPASLHFEEPNPSVPWGELGLAIASTARAWPDRAPRVAGVSSFGITGTNAHAIVGVHNEVKGEPVARAGEPHAAAGPSPVVLSARSEPALRAAAVALGGWLDQGQHQGRDRTLAELSWTTTTRREALPHRAAMVVESLDELRGLLDELVAGEAGGRVAQGVVPELTRPRVAFVFSGQGSQWLGMGRGLRATCPGFSKVLDEAAIVLEGMVDWSLDEVLAGTVAMDPIDVVQPTLAVIQIALARQLEAWGVSPDAVVGHSMGEVPAAHLAGSLTLEEALRVIVVRSRLLAEIAGQGAMALADEDAASMERRLERFGDRLSVAAINGPRSTVFSGDPDAVDELLDELDGIGVFCRRVRVDVASHSAQTEPLIPRLMAELEGLDPASGRVPFYSTVQATSLSGNRLDAAYWRSNLRSPVRFHDTVRSMMEDGFDVFIEVAPHPVLLSSLADIAADVGTRPSSIPLLRRDEPERHRVLEGLARLHVLGVKVDWGSVVARTGRPLRLPAYPWQRERHWLEDWEDWAKDRARGTVLVPRPAGADEVVYQVDWGPASSSGDSTVRPGLWIIVGDHQGLGAGLAERIRSAGGEAVVVPGGGGWKEDLLHPGRPLGGLVDLRAVGALADGTAGDVADVLEAVCRGPLDLARSLIARGLEPKAGIWWVTSGAQGTGHRAPLLPAAPQAALWGLGRTLWQEHPELGAHLVDLDPAVSEDASVQQLFSALAEHVDEHQVSFHAGEVHVPRLERAGAGALPSAGHWRADASYLVTGGLGDIGLAVAEEMVLGGATRLILMGRTALPPREAWGDPELNEPTKRRIDGILRLEGLGASVHLATVDVADREALSSFLTRFRAQQWPEIREVVHLAGGLDNHLVRDLTWEAFQGVLAGKAAGAWNLHTLLPEVGRMILFSSVVPVIPQEGQSNYAAANAMLDALASARSAAGSSTVSLAWGVWQGTGMVRDARVSRYLDRMDEDGLASFSRHLGRALFRWAASTPQPHLILAAVDWARAASRLEGRPGVSFYESFLNDAPARTGTLRSELSRLPAPRRAGALVEALRVLAGATLGVAPSALPLDQPLGRRGLDSLMAMEFRNRMETALDLRLPATVVWNYPTLVGLADHLMKRLGDPAPPATTEGEGEGDGERSAVEGDLAAMVAEVAEAPEDEVLRMLRENP